jgi:hypothetical protein
MKNLFLIVFLLTFASSAFAYGIPGTCIGMSGIEKKECICSKTKGTSSREVCKAELNAMKEKALAKTRSDYSGQGAGAGVNNFIGALPGMGGKGGEDEFTGLTSLVGIKNKHYIEFGMSVYFLPSEPGYKRQMPDRIFPNQLAYHYYLNPNWSAGLMWQDYTLKGTLFDPVTEKRMVDEEVTVVNPDGTETVEIRSVEKDVVIQQPGSDTMQIQRLFGVMAFHVDISKEVELEILGGYNLIYNVTYKTEGYEDETFSPPKPFMMSISAGYKPVDSDYMFTAGVRFVDSPTEAPNLMDYHNPGGAEIFFGARLGVF